MIRNDRFDARNFFDAANQPKPAFRLNQYGATLGGPLIRNRTFAFGFYEGIKIRQNQTFVRSVPTAMMRTGNLSELSRPIYDPLTYNSTTNQRQRFANDTIPRNRLDVSQRLTEMQYPLPNLPGVGGNYLWSPKRVSDSNQYGIRTDHQFSTNDNIFGRFTAQSFSLIDPEGPHTADSAKQPDRK